MTWILDLDLAIKSQISGQGFQKLESRQERQITERERETDRQTDRRDRTYYQYHATFATMQIPSDVSTKIVCIVRIEQEQELDLLFDQYEVVENPNR